MRGVILTEKKKKKIEFILKNVNVIQCKPEDSVNIGFIINDIFSLRSRITEFELKEKEVPKESEAIPFAKKEDKK